MMIERSVSNGNNSGTKIADKYQLHKLNWWQKEDEKKKDSNEIACDVQDWHGPL